MRLSRWKAIIMTPIKHKTCGNDVQIRVITVNTAEPGMTVGESAIWCDACGRFVPDESLSKKGTLRGSAMKIYIAAPYPCREPAIKVMESLEAQGHIITSR